MAHKPAGSQAAFLLGGLFGAALLTHELRRRRRLNVNGKVVLITGGSRGLGLLLARELGRLGARVVLVARDELELARAKQDLALRGIQADVLAADVTTEPQAAGIVHDTVARYGALDILINNAGVIKAGPLDHMTLTDFEEALAVHFWGPLHTMRAAIPHMRRAGGGRIVNISSIGGKIAVPHLAPYCASKFALTGLSTALRAELVRDRILVTTVSPGLMRTGSHLNASFKGRHRMEFAWFAIADSLPILSANGRRAAIQIVNALRRGDAELIITWPAKLAVAAAALAPNLTAWATGTTNRLLPSATDSGGSESRTGWESASLLAPSPLTALSDRAAVENNEMPAGD